MIIGAPFEVTKGLLEKVYKIDLVVSGMTVPDSTTDPYKVRPPYSLSPTYKYIFV